MAQSMKSSHHEISSKQISPLSKQIEKHKNKEFLLRQELQTLKEQQNVLRGDGKRAPSPDTKRFLKENTKLQLEICNKLKTINDVVHMLIGVMKESVTPSWDSSSAEQKPKQKWSQKFNYAFYDPEMHWCRVCNEFPLTAKDYLNHLHSANHQKVAAEHVESPWQNLTEANEGYQSLPNAPTKRTPFRGLQFFVPATGWFCKLCDHFIGDIQCASTHIKSVMHSKNYNKFVQQNPHWETDWMLDRQRALEQICTEDDKHKKLEESKTCSVKYVSQTVTISKHFSTKRPAKTPPPELEDKKRPHRKNKRKKSERSSTPPILGNISDVEFVDEEALNEKKIKDLVTDKPVDLVNEESSTASECRLSDENRKLLEIIKDSDSKNRARIKETCERELSRDCRDRRSKRNWRALSRELDRSEVRRLIRDRSKERKRSSKDRRNRRGSSRDRRSSSRDSRGSSRNRRRNSWNRRGSSPDRKGSSRNKRSSSRYRKGSSSNRMCSSRDRRGSSRKRMGSSRDRRVNSRDIRSSSRDSRSSSSNRTSSSRVRRGSSRDRRSSSQDRRSNSLDRWGRSRHLKDRQGTSSDRKRGISDKLANSCEQMSDSQTVELKTEVPLQNSPAALPTSLPVPVSTVAMPKLSELTLPAGLPIQAALPSVPEMAPPVMMPTPSTLVPPGSMPDVPKEFMDALELIFPTDPAKCAEIINTMQQPSLLGLPPGLPLPFPLGMMPPGIPFPFDYTAAQAAQEIFSTPPIVPQMTSLPTARLSKNKVTQCRSTGPQRSLVPQMTSLPTARLSKNEVSQCRSTGPQRSLVPQMTSLPTARLSKNEVSQCRSTGPQRSRYGDKKMINKSSAKSDLEDVKLGIAASDIGSWMYTFHNIV